MPPSNYGSDEKIQTWMEHLLPPVLTYIARKINLGVVLALVFVARQASKPYGFDFNADISDRDSWKWSLKEFIPLYTARVEKVQ